MSYEKENQQLEESDKRSTMVIQKKKTVKPLSVKKNVIKSKVKKPYSYNDSPVNEVESNKISFDDSELPKTLYITELMKRRARTHTEGPDT